jgi:hypothetical protein
MGKLIKVHIKTARGENPSVDMEAQFNPKELQIDKSVSWTNAQGPAQENPAQEFKEPQSSNLQATLYFDTYESKKDVYKEYITKLEKLVTIQSSGRPPLVTFTWNSFVFQGVVESLSQKYTMFLEDGTRCRCEVGFKMKSASSAKVSTKASGGSSGT